MPRYRYSVYDQRGALITGTIDAVSRKSALEALHQRGQLPLQLDEVGAQPATTVRWWQREISFSGGGLPLTSLAIFTRELATLIKADIPLDEVLRVVSIQPLIPRRMRTTALSLFEAVREGQSLSGAMSRPEAGFPEYYWRLVQAGEASGTLGEVLDNLARFLERSSETRAEIGSALLYPAVLLVAAAVAVGVILTVLLPTVVPLFKDAGAPLPKTLQVLVSAEAFLRAHAFTLVPTLIAVIAGLSLASRTPAVRGFIHHLLLRVPVIGGLIGDRETARFTRTLGTLVHNGVPMLDAVRISGNVLQNEAYAAAVREAGQALQEGRMLSTPLLNSGLFSELSMRLISVGEQTGQLETMLMRVADVYETTLQRRLNRFMSLLTPVLTLFIGALVGGLILSVMNAILSINELAKL